MFASTQPPLSVYVLFHAKSDEAQWMADYVFRWLRLHDETGLRGDGTAVGVPVYFRSVLQDDKLTPKIRWGDSTNGCVVILVDDHIVVDQEWHQALKDLLENMPQGRHHPARDALQPLRFTPLV